METVMPTEQANTDRVFYYPPNDFFHGAYVARIVEILEVYACTEVLDINCSIEAHQCKITIDKSPELFNEALLPSLRNLAARAYSIACKSVRKSLTSRGILNLFEETESQYRRAFLSFISSCGAADLVSGDDFLALLMAHRSLIGRAVEDQGITKRFDTYLKTALKNSPSIAAELIIDRFATEGGRCSHTYLPASLTSDDISEMMRNYLSSDSVNLNFVQVIASWPSKATVGNTGFKPSNDLVVAARKRSEELSQRLFSAVEGFKIKIDIIASSEQRACKSIAFEKNRMSITYGTDWLKEYSDNATVLNNLIYVFDLMSEDGLLYAPAHKHDGSVLEQIIGLKSLDEYPQTMEFRLRDTRCLASFAFYASFLSNLELRIEESIEWGFNDYIEAEFGVEGFYVCLPSKGSSTFDKCKSIGTEIERVTKCYMLFVEKGRIDADYLNLMQFKEFSGIPSRLKNKYAVEGPGFLPVATALLSNQSPLYFFIDKAGTYPNLLELLRVKPIHLDDYPEQYRPVFSNSLIEPGFIESDEHGLLNPTGKAVAIAKVWNEGAIACHHLSNSAREIVTELASDGYLEYYSGLLSPDEASYMNYVFNNSNHSNALALRNKYDHATFGKEGMNNSVQLEDYYRLLLLLAYLLLKINDELMTVYETGGIEDFVDWPLESSST